LPSPPLCVGAPWRRSPACSSAKALLSVAIDTWTRYSERGTETDGRLATHFMKQRPMAGSTPGGRDQEDGSTKYTRPNRHHRKTDLVSRVGNRRDEHIMPQDRYAVLLTKSTKHDRPKNRTNERSIAIRSRAITEDKSKNNQCVNTQTEGPMTQTIKDSASKKLARNNRRPPGKSTS